MRTLMLIVLVGGTALLVWALLRDTPEEDPVDPLPPGESAPAGELEAGTALRREPPRPEVEAGPAPRIAVLRPGEPLPSAESVPEPEREIRFTGGRGMPTGADVLQAVAKDVFVRALTPEALRALETVEVPPHWADPGIVLPIDEIFNVWREAGLEVEDQGHVLVVHRVAGPSGH